MEHGRRQVVYERMLRNTAPSEVRNRLVAAFSSQDFRAIEAHLEWMDLPKGRILLEEGDSINHVYFPCDAVVSLVSEMESGDVVDAATVGREGLVGYVAALGGCRAPTRDIVRVPGAAARIELTRLQAAQRERESLRQLLLRYVEAFSIQVLQSAACNALHGVRERYCTWLLMAQDRAGRDTLPLTQESLAEMLGVRRSSVNQVARTLQGAGSIRYRRGMITVTDRARLEDGACECYGIVRRQFKRLLPRTYG